VPIVQVVALRQPAGVDVDRASRAVALAVSNELGEAASGTWVTWQTLSPGGYREGETDAPSEQPHTTHPPIVRVLAFEGRPDDVIARTLSAVAETLADRLRLEPGNVFVTWEELSAGRVHTGGGLPGT
jgi:hypothetical protein